ncbi:MAG: flippase-like domain-containing protein [Caldilineales bacterium]|nr:flippase-like domain-containing protein [Caldilineales bacterium]
MDQAPRPLSPTSNFTRLGGYALSVIVLVLAAHLFLPQLGSFEQAMQVVRSMNLGLIALAALVEILVIVCGGFLVRSLLALAGAGLSLWRATLISVAAASVGLVAGGIMAAAAVTYRWTRKQGANIEGAMLAAWLPPILFNLVLVGLSIIGMAHLFFRHHLTRRQISGFGLALTALGLIVFFVWWGARHRQRVISWVVALAQHWAGWRRRAFDAASTEQRTRQVIGSWDVLAAGERRHLAAGAVIMVLLDALALYLVFRAAGQSPSLGVLMAGYALPLFVGRSVPVPGGIGVIEGMMVALYTGLGIPYSTAVTVVLIYRMLSFWIPGLAGLLIAVYIQHHPRMQAMSTR